MPLSHEEVVAALAAIDVSERKEARRAFIERRIQTSTMFNKYGLTHTESNQTIVMSLMDSFRNLVQAFFKGAGSGFVEKKCDACATTETTLQYDRAHERGIERGALALRALQRIRPDEAIAIRQKEVMKAFIQEHAEICLWYLCKPCHRAYDQKQEGA